MSRVQPEGRTYRLRGSIEGRERRFLVLAPGASLGSAPDQDLVIDVEGVSRRHARLGVHPEGLEVRDLGSKNGTWVDGRRLRAAEAPRVAPGTVLRFGPVELRVEAAPADDGRVGLVLSASDEPGSPAARHVADDRSPPGSTRGLSGGVASRRLDALAELATNLDRSVDVSESLADLVAALDVEGAALVRSDGERAVVVGAWGEIGDLDALLATSRLASRSASRRSGEEFSVSSESSAAVARRAGAEGEWALVVRGPLEEIATLRPFLAVASRLLRSATQQAPGEVEEPFGASAPAPGPPDLRFPPGHVVGRSARMVALYRHLAAIAGDPGPVLVLGETGVGKEHVARLVHEHSPRRDASFVAVNCAALPGELLEAELFGIERGVATGVDPRPGRFAEADGGTLFLDEIGEMPPALQAKLLRALESGEIQPLGGAIRRLDARVVCATHADLAARIEKGEFRADLYYRLALHVLEIPPLRERREDLPLFVERFLREASEAANRRVRGLTVAALERLVAHDWPGNVRELHHEVRRLVYACPEDGWIDSSLLSTALRASVEEGGEDPGSNAPLAERVDALERRAIRDALAEANGVLARAAEALGLHRNSLTQKMKRLGIEKPGEEKPSSGA